MTNTAQRLLGLIEQLVAISHQENTGVQEARERAQNLENLLLSRLKKNAQGIEPEPFKLDLPMSPGETREEAIERVRRRVDLFAQASILLHELTLDAATSQTAKEIQSHLEAVRSIDQEETPPTVMEGLMPPTPDFSVAPNQKYASALGFFEQMADGVARLHECFDDRIAKSDAHLASALALAKDLNEQT